jgi:uncharacterized phage protein (TIGR02220 family)
MIKQMFHHKGVATFWQTLEMIHDSPGLCLDCSIDSNWLKLVSYLDLTEDEATAIISMMARLDILDRWLWEKHKVLWAPPFVARLNEAFRGRHDNKPPRRPYFPGDPLAEKPESDVESTSENQEKNISRARNEETDTGNAISATKGNKTEKKTTTLSDSEKSDGTTEPPSPAIPYNEIIECLNVCSGQSFRASSKATKGLINARWGEGWRMSDFATVIRYKCEEWLHTDKEKYLRPETLFAATKFEGYLQAARLRQKDPCPLEELLSIWNANSPPLVPYVVRCKETDDAVRALYNTQIHSVERWTEYVTGCKSSDLMTGKINGWRPTLGWVCEPRRFSEIVNTDGYRQCQKGEEIF